MKLESWDFSSCWTVDCKKWPHHHLIPDNLIIRTLINSSKNTDHLSACSVGILLYALTILIWEQFPSWSIVGNKPSLLLVILLNMNIIPLVFSLTSDEWWGVCSCGLSPGSFPRPVCLYVVTVVIIVLNNIIPIKIDSLLSLILILNRQKIHLPLHIFFFSYF